MTFCSLEEIFGGVHSLLLDAGHLLIVSLLAVRLPFIVLIAGEAQALEVVGIVEAVLVARSRLVQVEVAVRLPRIVVITLEAEAFIISRVDDSL